MNNENLKPFKKGSKRASAAGKKSKRTASIKTALKNLLNSGKADAEEIAMCFLETAKDGNPAMAKLVMEYIDGKVKDELEVTNTQPPEKIQVEIIKPKKR